MTITVVFMYKYPAPSPLSFTFSGGGRARGSEALQPGGKGGRRKLVATLQTQNFITKRKLEAYQAASELDIFF